MPATIRSGRDEATIKRYLWTCRNKVLRDYLNSMLDPHGPSGADPDPDYTAALAAAERVGGEVISHEPVKSEPGKVY